MKQLVQNFKTGETKLVETPIPSVGSGKVLIKTHRSLVSLGTERMLVSFGQASMIGKIKQQPHRVKEVINKMKSDGVKATLDTVNTKLNTPINLGYSNAGEVIAIGKGVTNMTVGDRVVSNGSHSEYVVVPENLVAKIPDEVSYDEACFTVVSSIGLQGIRLINPSYGETIVVIGLGLIGLISVQLLKANGCKVIGIDPDIEKVSIARELGIEAFSPIENDSVSYVNSRTGGEGADGVLITASAKTNDIIKQSAQMSRKRGRIVLVGVIGLSIDRADFYEKELTFQVSCSYGPGRYTRGYEEKGLDYPIGFIRWTENRNFQAILTSLQNGSLKVKDLITETLDFNDFDKIYGNIGTSKSIATVFQYPITSKDSKTVELNAQNNTKLANIQISGNQIALIGSGNFTQARVIPALYRLKAKVKYVVSANGLSSTISAEKLGAKYSTTDFEKVLDDTEVGHIIITTRHNLHAPFVIKALKANKNVFVEKPLAINKEELEDLIQVEGQSTGNVIVGFNRRFSPHSIKAKMLLGNNPSEMTVIATMNAGYIPSDSWVQDMETGGGRIIGEACHLIDFISYLTNSEIERVSTQALGSDPNCTTDNASIHLKYKNGSLGIINYFANGNKSYPKERVEIFYQGKNIVIDNFRKTYAYGFESSFRIGNRVLKTKQDKGHKEQFDKLHNSWAKGLTPIIPFESIINTTKASFAAIDSLILKKSVEI